MPRERTCDFCGDEIEPGTGTMFVHTNGTTVHYCSGKCEKNADLGREARDLEWTETQRPQSGPEESDADTESEADAGTEDGSEPEARSGFDPDAGEHDDSESDAGTGSAETEGGTDRSDVDADEDDSEEEETEAQA